jgi:hypothetical protein
MGYSSQPALKETLCAHWLTPSEQRPSASRAQAHSFVGPTVISAVESARHSARGVAFRAPRPRRITPGTPGTCCKHATASPHPRRLALARHTVLSVLSFVGLVGKGFVGVLFGKDVKYPVGLAHQVLAITSGRSPDLAIPDKSVRRDPLQPQICRSGDLGDPGRSTRSHAVHVRQ